MRTKSTPDIPSATYGGGLDSLDVSLLRSAANRDSAALRTLFMRHNVKIFRYVLRLTANKSVAEETVSDVFLEVWRHGARFEMKSQVSTWLLAIARYKAFAAMRRRSASQLHDGEFPLSMENPADSPGERLDKTDRGAATRICLTRLSPTHREVIDLVYYHGKSVSEVAEIVGIPVSSVKTRMHCARNRIENLLEQAGIVR